MFQNKVVEKIRTHVLFSLTFSSKLLCLRGNVEKYCTAGQAADNMKHAQLLLCT